MLSWKAGVGNGSIKPFAVSASLDTKSKWPPRQHYYGPFRGDQARSRIASDIDILRIEASNEGFRFIERLVTEWNSGANRFDKPGEIFAGIFENGRLVAVGGLNADPFTENTAIARLRHIYALKRVRRKGIASSLVRYLLDIARTSFTAVRLFTDTAEAAAFYETLGFSRLKFATATHIMRVG